jgi:hypothetical protein
MLVETTCVSAVTGAAIAVRATPARGPTNSICQGITIPAAPNPMLFWNRRNSTAVDIRRKIFLWTPPPLM